MRYHVSLHNRIVKATSPESAARKATKRVRIKRGDAKVVTVTQMKGETNTKTKKVYTYVAHRSAKTGRIRISSPDKERYKRKLRKHRKKRQIRRVGERQKMSRMAKMQDRRQDTFAKNRSFGIPPDLIKTRSLIRDPLMPEVQGLHMDDLKRRKEMEDFDNRPSVFAGVDMSDIHERKEPALVDQAQYSQIPMINNVMNQYYKFGRSPYSYDSDFIELKQKLEQLAKIRLHPSVWESVITGMFIEMQDPAIDRIIKPQDLKREIFRKIGEEIEEHQGVGNMLRNWNKSIVHNISPFLKRELARINESLEEDEEFGEFQGWGGNASEAVQNEDRAVADKDFGGGHAIDPSSGISASKRMLFTKILNDLGYSSEGADVIIENNLGELSSALIDSFESDKEYDLTEMSWEQIFDAWEAVPPNRRNTLKQELSVGLNRLAVQNEQKELQGSEELVRHVPDDRSGADSKHVNDHHSVVHAEGKGEIAPRDPVGMGGRGHWTTHRQGDYNVRNTEVASFIDWAIENQRRRDADRLASLTENVRSDAKQPVSSSSRVSSDDATTASLMEAKEGIQEGKQADGGAKLMEEMEEKTGSPSSMDTSESPGQGQKRQRSKTPARSGERKDDSPETPAPRQVRKRLKFILSPKGRVMANPFTALSGMPPIAGASFYNFLRKNLSEEESKHVILEAGLKSTSIDKNLTARQNSLVASAWMFNEMQKNDKGYRALMQGLKENITMDDIEDVKGNTVFTPQAEEIVNELYNKHVKKISTPPSSAVKERAIGRKKASRKKSSKKGKKRMKGKVLGRPARKKTTSQKIRHPTRRESPSLPRGVRS